MSAIATITPTPWFTGFDDDGNVLSLGKLYVFYADTDTPCPTYADRGENVQNSHPIVLDAAGRATVFLPATTVDYELYDADGALIHTADGIASVVVGTSIVAELWTFGGSADTPITAAAYPSGTGFDTCHAGTSIFNINSANIVGDFQLECMIMAVGGGTATVALVNLTDGAPDTPLVTCTGTSATGARAISATITFASAGAAKNYAIKVKVSSGSGYVWGVKVTRVAV